MLRTNDMGLFGNSVRPVGNGKSRELAFAGERQLLPSNPSMYADRDMSNPAQRYGQGFDPVTGTMSLSAGGEGIAPTMRDIQPGDFAAPRPVKPNFFGKGGLGWDIVGALADGFSVAGGGQPWYQLGQQQRREAELEEARWQRRRAIEMQDRFDAWRQQYDYERANPRPVNNDTIQDFEFIRQRLGDDAADEYLRSRSQGGFVGVDVQQQDGSVIRQFYPKSGLTRPGASTPPPAAVAALRANPTLRGQFDAKYGPGTAARYLGGATGNPSRTFP